MPAPRPIILLLLPFFAACVAYDEQKTDVQLVADEVAARPGGTFSVEQALARGLRDNPELRALEAQARAAAAATTVPLLVQGEYRGRNETVGAMLDPIAWLGLGPRGAAIEVADARYREALTQLAVARWQVTAEIVETFAVDAALAELDAPAIECDVAAFEDAGLAAPVAAAQLRAAIAHAGNERVELQRVREDNRARLRHLLGLSRAADLDLLPLPDSCVQQPEGTDAELLRRPDLALAAAAFEVRDREFRQAVADQYPSIMLGPNLSLRSDPLRAMAVLNVPVAMHGLAEAARERRQAARDLLEDRLLEAGREASYADQRLAAAAAMHAATSEAVHASEAAFASARAALDVEVDAFGAFAAAARAYARDSREHRSSTVELARARVARAVAFGWPITEEPR